MCQTVNERLDKIILGLKDAGLSALIIPSSDPHQSEYLPDHWKIREWVSGFTGSAGSVVVSTDIVGLWTDSRYFLQAETELSGSRIQLFKQGEEDVPTPLEFLIDHLPEKSKVALNPRLWSTASIIDFEEKLSSNGMSLSLDYRIAEDVWNKCGRPDLPKENVFEHSTQFVDRSIKEKLQLVRDQMKEQGVSQHLITTLDDIAWIYNMRGNDIEYNPVFMSFTMIRENDALLFIDPSKVSESLKSRLEFDNVHIKAYQSIEKHLTKVDQKVLINPNDCNHHLVTLIPPSKVTKGPTISRLIKACKTPKEVNHIERAMIKDGLALTKAFCELLSNLPERAMTEYDFAQLIAKRRSEQAHYYGESFPAIVGYQANGAIVHYRPSKNGSAIIEANGLLLCDSGGQYFDGTTDITRTIAVGPVTEEQRDRYTRVLKGHIAIDTAVFPKGTTGGSLDILARQYLWKQGLNFGHGTGHGVGYFLNVHEPPQGISPGNSERATTALLPGMLTSNEPGFYKDGEYGIRLENLIITEECEHEGYLNHRHLTLFPFDTSVIVNRMMTKDEINWINEYHLLVWKKLSPHLDGGEHLWLKRMCRAI